MFSLPQLIDEDIHALDMVLGEFLDRSGSIAALVVDQGGFVITQKGKLDDLDTATLGALAANSFAATHAMAKLVNEEFVSSIYQEGEKNSVLISSLAGYGFLVVVFPAEIGVGSVKYHASSTLKSVISQLDKAQERAPGDGLDLSDLNLADTAVVFKRK
jgi:predicted regulator of Ras-like GTPase activity (Roadblock/LC7/MglB family)